MTQKPIFKKRGHLNLLQQIRAARTIREIAQLLVVGSAFEHASEKSRARWTTAAEKRKAELES